LNHVPFRAEFERRPEVTLTLHVTGPVPVEHQLCLEHVLASYLAALDAVPAEIADRLFLALSAGCQSHPTLDDDVGMVDIYQLADLVLFPSLTEGRGLPIAEASAAGVPIVCSEYQPLAVFSEVVGHHLDPEHRIVYDKFPDAQFSDELLDHITAILFEPSTATEHIEHNRAAVKGRFALEVLQSSLDEILDRLALAVREI
jgi:glycosyltransferase involved in cell wall biosynthesis